MSAETVENLPAVEAPPQAPPSEGGIEPPTGAGRSPGAPTAPAQPSSAEGRATISLRDVTRRFGNVTSVKGLSMDIDPGRILGLIGPSGSGKTTTVRMLAGVLKPTSGHVRVLGEEPHLFRRSTREQIGYMPQGVVLYPDLTCSENLDFMASLFGLLFRRRRRRVAEALKLLDLWSVRNRRASALSGGMQRRLELACAMVHDPAILLLDEPTVGVDPLLRRSIWQELHRLRDAGRTVLVTTQYVSEAEECDLVALLADGRLVAFDTPEGIRHHALGGDIVEVQTDRAVDAEQINDRITTSTVRQNGSRSILAVSPDGASATPDLLEAIEAGGAKVVSIQEHRPSFDDIFEMLVRRAARVDLPSTQKEGASPAEAQPPGRAE